jgi:hypothetical protein
MQASPKEEEEGRRAVEVMDRAAKELAKPGTITTTAYALQQNIILVFIVCTQMQHLLELLLRSSICRSVFCCCFQVCWLVVIIMLQESSLHCISGLWTR